MSCYHLSVNKTRRSNFLPRMLLTGTLSLGLAATLFGMPALTARLPNDRIVFDRSPALVEASVMRSELAENGQFQIVINLPENAGEPMEAIVVHARDPGLNFPFDPTGSEAYLGQPGSELAAIPLASVGGLMISPNEVLVVFAEPVEPGNQVTVWLQSKFSPPPGIYEFGVTVFPSGDNPVGQFLGYEMLRF